jgi:cytosine/uracil/thiamine/allantoin permease
MPKVPQSVLIIAIGVLATALAGWLSMDRYETFLFLVGSVFVPLFGVLIADYFVNARRRIDTSELFSRHGRYWYAGGVRIAALIPWLLGFAVYHWILPTGPSVWVDAITSISGSPLADRFGWLSASIPSFLVSFLVGTIVLRDSRKGEISSPRPQTEPEG